MTITNELQSFRSIGVYLLVTVIIFLVGAGTAAYFRNFPLPVDPLDKLKLIANDRVGWTLQAVIFPVAFLATAVIFGFITTRLNEPVPHWLGIGATILFGLGFLFWLPISIDRLQLGANAAEMIRTFNPESPPIVMEQSWFFWPNTLVILGAIALMGTALALAGTLPLLGFIVTGLAVLGLVAGPFIMHDWPPFLSYVFLLVLAIGLIRLPG
jgi:hypothetical protein